ncbi:Uncharacterised protein [Staphylococcus intermedius NCTC 11048]|uniref:Uncharacterized protein n=1 Tax=Staphylococcus intermedius NCTC 11048 TaxID=1141106 RepID=A0A380G5W4_STAIN|nr:Uncharacterised protein [Staphylococcus intermedius NCTC 11048]
MQVHQPEMFTSMTIPIKKLEVKMTPVISPRAFSITY